MIERYVFSGYAAGDLTVHAPAEIRNLSLFDGRDLLGENRVFLYFETELPASEVDPDAYISGPMKCWPNGARWRRMMDIFHYSEPQSAAHWARHIENHRPTLRLVYLRPHMVSRYIFLHYQLQEERPKPMLSKFGSIYLDGDLLALYEEHPLEPEDDLYPGCLDTHNTPAPWADAVGPAFAPWKDGVTDWKYIPLTAKANQE